MNSIYIEAAAVRIAHELIRFTHPDEWQQRLAFRQSLTLKESDLSHFVGGYNLPKDLYQRCGLSHGGNPCNQQHGLGFVVASKKGLETHVGKDCGLKHLGAKFEEMERLFTAGIKTQDLTKRMRELTSRRGELLHRAEQAIIGCDRASKAVGEIRHRIGREPGLADVLKRALTSDGSIFKEVKVSDEEYEDTRQRYRREVFGRIDGFAATTAKSPKADIQAIVLPFLHNLTTEMLAGLSDKNLAAKSKEAGDAEDLLTRAEAYIALCKRFVSRRNWESFAAAFEPGRLPTSDRSRRLLKQLIESGI
jgi:hypothetical protein